MKISELVSLAKVIAPTIDRDRTHLSFILHKSRIVSIGTNAWKTHPITIKLGYKMPWMHSELAAYSKLNRSDKKLTLFNIRLSKTGVMGMSKPCSYCLPWCLEVFDKIYYSLDRNNFECLYGSKNSMSKMQIKWK